MSSFGGPGGGQKVFKPTPPERGSFPLDHDGECKAMMTSYLRCLRSHRGMNDPECRGLSKSYLQCRMERNLMAPDSMKNLGFQDLDAATTQDKSPTTTSQPGSSNTDATTQPTSSSS
ncbi:hypothetical protein BU16DRAFT_357865 [Lophium mytilinum]|uniref:CHCH domain-containing protein n=1 Tax=Lophium mytilinum TaxID=390894 RepID=A0A6A6QTU7_9PEZI|nr:hypothetical protein BU16DRAFT_357865 [Lophium mytilinum]